MHLLAQGLATILYSASLIAIGVALAGLAAAARKRPTIKVKVRK